MPGTGPKIASLCCFLSPAVHCSVPLWPEIKITPQVTDGGYGRLDFLMLAIEVLCLRLSLKSLISHVLGRNQILSMCFGKLYWDVWVQTLVLLVAVLRDLWRSLESRTDWKGLVAFCSVLNVN